MKGTNSRKRMLSMILVLVMAATLLPVSALAAEETGETACSLSGSLNTVEHFGYIVGYEDGTIRPMANITRAEAASIFYRLLSDETRAKYYSTENSYSDVSAESWYNTAVSAMTAMGIMVGDADGSFRPDDSVTRAELVKMVVTVLGIDANVEGNAYTDLDGHWASHYINVAAGYSLLTFEQSSEFHPDQAITRAEAVSIINRALGRTPHADGMCEGMITFSDNMDTTAWYYADIQEAANSHDYEVGALDGVYEAWTSLENDTDESSEGEFLGDSESAGTETSDASEAA